MKKYILLLLLLISVIAVGCNNSTNNYIYDKENPQEIILKQKSNVTFMNIVGDDYYQEWQDLGSFSSEKTVTLPADFFMSFYQGNYTLKLANDKNDIYTYNISVTGYDKTYNYITKKQIFDLEDDVFYVLVTRDVCAGCEILKPDAYKFNDFLSTFNSIHKNNFYVIDGGISSSGENEDLTGIDNYDDLISNAKMYTPTLLIVEKNIIASYYVGNIEISAFFNQEIERIKGIEIIKFVAENPLGFSIPIDFVPTNFSIKGNNIDKSFRSGSHYSDGSEFFMFSNDFFSIYLPGNYSLNIFNESGDSKLVEVRISGSFNYILLDNLFDISTSEYYVFFLKTGCSGCNAAKPTLIKYDQYTKLNSSAIPLYAVHRSMNGAFNTTGEENTIGVYNANDLSLTTVPRVLHIKNGVVIEEYSPSTTTTIIQLFENLMK
ncbi:MAG TPA: hypothetical protein VJZ51_03425 [Bacilli bacterium]|nr:hypothetical protein [Bacilli bacterium]